MLKYECMDYSVFFKVSGLFRIKIFGVERGLQTELEIVDILYS